MKLNISYCGGCNPLYERSAFVKKFLARLRERFPGPVEVVYGRDKPADIGVVIAGCTVCCPDREEKPLPVLKEFLIGPALLNYKSMPENELIEQLVAEIMDYLKNLEATGMSLAEQGSEAVANVVENQGTAYAR